MVHVGEEAVSQSQSCGVLYHSTPLQRRVHHLLFLSTLVTVTGRAEKYRLLHIGAQP
uniref:Uncharacterized protein n=1 Tax=Anguilla anguilla TaxID=7936 RepID=A0A0E9TR67_ANGAN